MASMFVMLLGCVNNTSETDFNNTESALFTTFPGLGFHQSMAFSNEKALFIIPEGGELRCNIFDIKTGAKESAISLPLFDDFVPHANCACFSDVYISSDSCFPTLYVSSWNGKRQAYVYDFKKNGSTYTSSLVQLIDPTNVSPSIIGNGYINWVVDIENSLLYSVAYELPASDFISEGNSTRLTWFNLPKVNNENSIVYLSDSDVCGNMVFPVMNAFQDMLCFEGVIYVVAGYPNQPFFENKYYTINPTSGSFTERAIPLAGEPEGFCLYNRIKILYMANGSSRVHFIDNYYN